MQKSVVLFSGGIDSSAAMLHQLSREDTQVTPLYIHYGQKNGGREKYACHAIVSYLQALGQPVEDMECLAIPDIMRWHGTHSLAALNPFFTLNPHVFDLHGADLDDNGQPDKPMDSTVHFRNIVFISLASTLARCIGASTVAVGANPTLKFPSTDEKPNTLAHLERALYVSDISAPHIFTPFPGIFDSQKTALVEMVASGMWPLDMMWSCENWLPRPCGVCSKCTERMRLMFEIGAYDANYMPQSEIWKFLGGEMPLKDEFMLEVWRHCGTI